MSRSAPSAALTMRTRGAARVLPDHLSFARRVPKKCGAIRSLPIRCPLDPALPMLALVVVSVRAIPAESPDWKAAQQRRAAWEMSAPAQATIFT